MLRKLGLFLGILLIAHSAFAVTITPLSFKFRAIPNGSKTCAAVTGGATVTLTAGLAANSPDIILRNISAVPIYFEITTASGGATAAVATSQVINPGEADLLSKESADTISCITSSSSGSLIATPGTGN